MAIKRKMLEKGKKLQRGTSKKLEGGSYAVRKNENRHCLYAGGVRGVPKKFRQRLGNRGECL